MAIEKQKNLITLRVPTKESGYEFNGRIWTKSSKPLIWADGVSYCRIRGTKMQTLDDAVEFRYDSNGADGSADYQNTGTLMAVVRDGKALRAHIYEPEQDELEALANRKDIKTGSTYSIDVKSTSDLGKRIIGSTKNTGRTFVVPDNNLELSVLPANGVTEYGTNGIVLQLMPRCAEKHAAYIAGKGRETEFVVFDWPNLNLGQMSIRPVGLGGGGCDGIGAGSIFGNVGGRVRGQSTSSQKSSSGNERLAESKK